MSDKLVVEFYDLSNSGAPTACVLACHGGDNPSQAATTLTDFLMAVAGISEPRFEDAGLLAARFVAWEGQRGSRKTSFDFFGCLDHSTQSSSWLSSRAGLCWKRAIPSCRIRA